jgi:hypothetical protein
VQPSSERKVNICDSKVSRSTCTKHLGISRNEKNSINIDEKLKSGRAAIYGMLGESIFLSIIMYIGTSPIST